MPQILFGILAFFIALAALGIYALVQLPGLIRRALPGPWQGRKELPHPTPPVKEADPPSSPDLQRYPRELEGLEGQLATSLGAVRTQREHLAERQTALASKAGRGELAARYAEDLELLDRREAGMRRVLGLVWKARALLTLRAHLAESARGRPELPALPAVDDPNTDLEAASAQYANAATRVRAFLLRVERRAEALVGAVPPSPAEATVPAEVRDEVEAELRRVAAVYADWQESLDRLADTLSYLSDRSRTRSVVQGSPAQLGDAGGEALMAEVERALGQLHELAEAGDRKLADLAVKNLAEDISQLERAGLEARAEAEAAIEVARLLEQF